MRENPLRQFLFFLAGHLGMTVHQLEQGMGSLELSEWLVFSRIHPLPDAHWDAARICQVISAANGSKAKLSDFLPPTRKAKQTREGMRMKLNAALGVR